ncbi:hypothetical protein K435DRAFT_608441, partial [Dendrothele bispora CBS 962.96]
LGSKEHYEVYEAECVGLLLAMHLIQQETGIRKAAVWVDNQAALQAIQTNKSGPAHYILDWVHSTINQIKTETPRTRISFAWVPSHIGIAGNETADEHAKLAAEG